MAPLSPREDAFANHDARRALSSLQNDVELLADLTKLFRHYYPTLIDEIGASMQERDSLRLREAAHRLCGAISIFGSEPAVDLARRLEQQAERDDWSETDGCFANLRANIDATLSGIDSYLEQLSRG